MNITKLIEDRLNENKSSVRSYITFASADSMGVKLSKEFNEYNNTDIDVDYIVTFIPTVGRYTVIFNLSAWSARSKTGTYLGWFAQRGFFSI